MYNPQIENTIDEIRERSGADTLSMYHKISNVMFKALVATSKADRGLADQLANNIVKKQVEKIMLILILKKVF